MHPDLTVSTYMNFHRKIRRVRGRACELPCVDCGKQALDWSLIHGAEPLDLASYVSRCRGCHRRYDYTDEWRAKVSAATKGRPSPKRGIPLTAEHRAKVSAGGKGKKKPEGFGAMVAERNRNRVWTTESKAKAAESARRLWKGLGQS